MIGAGADIGARDAEGLACLHIYLTEAMGALACRTPAAMGRFAPERVQLMLNDGASASATAASYPTPLDTILFHPRLRDALSSKARVNAYLLPLVRWVQHVRR